VTAFPLLVRGVRRVATVHEMTWLHASDETRLLRVHKIRTALASRWADAIVVNSRHTMGDLVRLHPKTEGRVTVVHPSVDPKFRPASAEQVGEVRRRLDLPTDYFVFVGRIEPKKNIDGMVRALARLPSHVELVLVGRLVYEEQAFDQLLARAGVTGRVRRPGFLADEELVPLLTGARALVYPSFMEGFGIPPLEAMACGTPAIVSRRGALPEVVGEAALLVEPEDISALAEAMRRTLEDAATRADLVERGLRRAGEFTARRSVEALLGLYAAMERAGVATRA
jgi:alpha-1,3-rhamnosyl/mannosyltransferase